MKTLSILFSLSLFFMTFNPVSAQPEPKSAVLTLTAKQVTSAIDIETAIHQVTLEGQRPGVIILDGREGPFKYAGPDRSINIFFSNLTLRGANNAFFPDTDGVYIDHVPADHLVIENLVMKCSGDCIGMVGTHNHVIVRNNVLTSGAMGIGVNGGSSWSITNNTIQAKVFAIFLIGTQNATVMNNHLSGYLGIVLDGARLSNVRENAISSGWQGVLLKSEASRNLVANNSILGIQQGGVSLEPGVQGNTIRSNTVLCAYDAPCVTVDAGPAEVEANTVKENRP